MSTLDSLIRVNRWQIDERRRQLADLEALAEKLRLDQRRLNDEDLREQRVAAASLEASFTYAGYADGLIERRRKLAQSLVEVADQTVTARQALADAFEEMKRYEITAANRVRQAQLREGRRQQQVMDDLGVEAFRRRGAAGE
jgi:flagellar FliJ protein